MGRLHRACGRPDSDPARRLTPQRFTRGSQGAETYSGGPLAGALATALLQTAPVIGVRVAATIAGTVSVVSHTGTGAGLLATSGTPNDLYNIAIKVTRPGTIANGEAAVTVSDIATALESLLQTCPDLRYIHVLGIATPALLATVDTILIERETRTHYIHALLEARPMSSGETQSDYLAAIDTQFSGLTAMRCAIALYGGETYNPLTRRLEPRSNAWKLTAQRATRPIGEAPYRVRTGHC